MSSYTSNEISTIFSNLKPGPQPTLAILIKFFRSERGRRARLMVSALEPGSSGPGSSPNQGHSVMFLARAFFSSDASLHPGV